MTSRSRRASRRASTLIAGVAVVAATATSLRGQGTFASNRVVQWYQRASELPSHPLHTDALLCGQTSVDITGNCGVPGLSVSVHSAAQLGGVLRAASSVSAAGGALTLHGAPADVDYAGVYADAYASTWDRVFINGLTPSVLRFRYHVDGLMTRTSTTGIDYLNPSAGILFGASQTGTPTLSLVWVQPAGGSTSGVVRVDYSGFVDVTLAGTGPFDFSMALFSDAFLSDAAGQTLDGAAQADFTHTVRFGVAALDANGNDMTAAANLTFAGGPYPVDPLAAVPEPGAGGLVASGLGVLALGWRRRRAAS